MADSDSPVSPCFPGLPDHLAWAILEWSRPDDDSMFIWKWLCCVAGTCRQFRRLLREEEEEVSRSLLPTVFELKDNWHYIIENPPRIRQHNGPTSLRIKLMEMIRNSDWMRSRLTRVRAEYPFPYRPRDEIVEGLKLLLTAPGLLPNLAHLHIQLDEPSMRHHLDDRFLRGIAREHPDLKSLTLSTIDAQRVSSHTLAMLARSMRQLQEATIYIYPCFIEGLASNHHVSSFVSHLPGETLTSLTLFCSYGPRAADNAFECLVRYLPNLKSLTIASDRIKTLQLANIIRSKNRLSHLTVFFHRESDLNVSNHRDQGVITTIGNMQLPLETFRAPQCPWLRDDGIMTLLESQIDAGEVTLTNLGVYETEVTPDGLRAFLTKWRESNAVRPLTVEVFIDEEEYNEPWRDLVVDFPEVEFEHCQSFDTFSLIE